MSVDRKFLDLFWTVSGEDQSNIDGAVKSLCDTLAKKTGEARNNYFAYTRERLVKGLKSFTEHARTGFSKTLLAFLTRFPLETTNAQLFEVLNKHIYQSSFSTKTEESSVKYAYLSCADIFYRTKRLNELDTENIGKIVEPLLSLTQTVNWGPDAMRQLGLLASQLPSKVIKKFMVDGIRNTWTAMNSTDGGATGDQLLFLLRLQDKLPNFFRDNLQTIDLSAKKFRKKFVTVVFSCSLSSALSLLDEAVYRSCFDSIWPKVCDFAVQGSNPKRMTRLLHFVAHVVCSHDAHITRTCLNDTVLQLFAVQLAYRKHTSYAQACQSMSSVLKTIVQRWTAQHSQHPEKEARPMETDADDAVPEPRTVPTSPGTLFSCFASASYPIDLVGGGSSAPKPCQFLLERAPKAIDPQDLITYAGQLMHLFTETKLRLPAKPGPDEADSDRKIGNTDGTRQFVTNQLQLLLLASLQQQQQYSDQLHRELIDPVLRFLITVGLTALGVNATSAGKHISPRTSTASWVALFRFLNALFTRSARPDHSKLAQPSCDPSHVLQLLVRTAVNCLEAAVQSGQQLSDLIVPHLRHSLDLLSKVDPTDVLGMHMAQLHTTACLFILSQPSAEWNQAMTLLDDLKECVKRRKRDPTTTTTTNKSKTKPEAQDPAWSAVLADVLLGLISYPSHMLRSIVRLTFERLVAGGQADAECLRLIADVIRTRLFKGMKKTDADQEDEEEASGDDADTELITFRTDFDEPPEDEVMTGEPQNDSNDEADEADPEAEETAESESDSSAAAAGSESDEDRDSDADDDDDDEEEEEKIDDAKLTAIRESVRKALGPAALDEDELDSTGYREFTDEEMFARDAALVAAFRANRMRAPERKVAEQARSLGQMKMRCLDLLSCIVQHSPQTELLLPTLTVLLDIGKLAAECENKAKQKSASGPGNAQNRQRASFTARYGDLPSLTRVAEVLRLLPSRSAAVQRQLAGALDSTEPLVEVMQSVVKAAQFPHPSQLYARSLCLVVQFLYRVAQLLETPDGVDWAAALSGPLLAQLAVFVNNSRKCTVHRSVFVTLLTQCPAFSVHAAKLLFDAVCEFLTKCTTHDQEPEQQLSNADQFASMQCFDLLAHVFQTVATGSDQNTGQVIKKLPEKVLKRFWSITDSTQSTESSQVSTTPWLNSVAFATAFFNLMQWSLKAAQRLGRPQTVAPELLDSFRQLDSPLKPVRQAARRFVTFVEEWSRQTGKQIAVVMSREEKLRLKAERKKARQANRREKALRQQQRREARLLAEKNAQTAVAGTGTVTKKNKKKTNNNNKKQVAKPSVSDSVALKTNPKPKEIKPIRTEQKKRKQIKPDVVGSVATRKAKRARTE